MMNVKPARKSKSQGQAMAEFGLILPVLLLIITGIIDFGQVTITYIQSLSALRNAARYAEVAGFATVPGAPIRYLDCDGMIDAANDILFANNQTITITYHKANDYGSPPYTCDTVTANALRNGDILQIISRARVQFITPFVSGILPDLTIEFAARRTIIKSLVLGSDDKTDTDYDGLDDEWEMRWFGNLNAIATGDPDGDGCNNGCEEVRDTCPIQAGCSAIDSRDSDSDGLNDADEAYLYDTDGRDTDSDDDGLTDYEEVKGTRGYITDPNDPDTDNDGLPDLKEIEGSYDHLPTLKPTSPLLPDTDGDGISDYDEIYGTLGYETDPNNRDTDGDGLEDRYELDTVYEGGLTPKTDPTNPDTDGDGLTDGYEVNTLHDNAFRTNPTHPDSDGDGLTDGYEVNTFRTRPWHIDTDDDGLSDGEEFTWGTYPTLRDSDSDRLSDGDEVHEVHGYGTEPMEFDTDGDTVWDGVEVLDCLTSPLRQETTPGIHDSSVCGAGNGEDWDTDRDNLPDAWEKAMFGGSLQYGPGDDPDGDGLTNEIEKLIGTHANTFDTDGDGRGDGEEVSGSNGKPTSNPKMYDTDGDGLNDGVEVNTYGTNPNMPDTDNDGLNDNVEVYTTKTNPLAWDTDSDGLSDGSEVNVHGTKPLVWDTDGDGLSDGEEINGRQVTNPLLTDTDGDGLNDFDEIRTWVTDPNKTDTDGDGLTDGDEVKTYKTNPNKSDTDGDTLSDYNELFAFAPDNPMKVTDPLVQDTDRDGKRDDFELANGTLPNNPIAISALPASVQQENNPNKPTTMTVTIKLDKPSVETTRVRYRTSDGTPPNAATLADGDYDQILATELVFVPGETTKTFAVTIWGQNRGSKGDDTGDEHFYIVLTNNDNAYIATAQTAMTIQLKR